MPWDFKFHVANFVLHEAIFTAKEEGKQQARSTRDLETGGGGSVIIEEQSTWKGGLSQDFLASTIRKRNGPWTCDPATLGSHRHSGWQAQPSFYFQGNTVTFYSWASCRVWCWFSKNLAKMLLTVSAMWPLPCVLFRSCCMACIHFLLSCRLNYGL